MRSSTRPTASTPTRSTRTTRPRCTRSRSVNRSDLRLLVKTLKDATVVPDDAIQHSTDGLYAYTVNPDNKAEVHKVKVSQSIDGRSVVDEGLSPGQQVITGGQFKVQPGTLVATAVASSDPARTKVKQE